MLRRISPRSLLIACVFAGHVLFLVHYFMSTGGGACESGRFEDLAGNAHDRMEKGSPVMGKSSLRNYVSNEMYRDKYLIAFSYWEQFSMATRNLLSLTALAARTGRRVVVPFVNGSKFFGNEETGTLERYYNISELNRFLRSKGFATLVSLEEFNYACEHKLDALLTFLLNDKHPEGPMFYPCNDHTDTFQGFHVENSICIEHNFSSIKVFKEKVIKDSSCIGIKMWRGHDGDGRTKFPLPNDLGKLELHHYFSASLVQIADDFRAKILGSCFISVHLRLENIPGIARDHGWVKQCVTNLSTKVKQAKDRYSADECKVFVTGDFTVFGSYSGPMVASRRIGGESLGREFVSKLNAVTFDPSIYSITDRGSVAIIEMLILRSGIELYCLGGGSFQGWIKMQFIEQHFGDKTKVYHPVDCSAKAMSLHN